MTTEELIIGHFEGDLDAAEAEQLRDALDASPDARALFENHESLHSLLRTDAATLVPAAPLVSRVLDAALATPSEVATKTVSRWGVTQIAAGFGALVLLVGGTLIATRPSETALPAPAPAVAPPAITLEPTVPNLPQTVEGSMPKVERAATASRSVEPRRNTVERSTTKQSKSAPRKLSINRNGPRYTGSTTVQSSQGR